MKDIKSINESILIVTLSLIIGLLLGLLIPARHTIGVKSFFHGIYVKLNPDSQKDSKTLIIEKVSQNNYTYSGNSIFDEPKKKENKYFILIKKIFKRHNPEKEQTIHNFVLN